MFVINTADPFKIIKKIFFSLSIIVYSSFDNLDYFPLTFDNKKPIIRDLILVCIACRPNYACNIYKGTFYQTNNLSEEIIMYIFNNLAFLKPNISQPYNATGKITWSNKYNSYCRSI